LPICVRELIALVIGAQLVLAFCAGFCVALGVFTPLATTTLTGATLTAVAAGFIALTALATFRALLLLAF
jgi:hypothetical protein